MTTFKLAAIAFHLVLGTAIALVGAKHISSAIAQRTEVPAAVR